METAKGVMTPEVCAMRGRRWSVLVLAILTIGFLSVRTSNATIVPLSSLTNGQAIVVGSLVFSDFSISGSFNAGDINIDYPFQDSNGKGIEITGPLSALSTDNLPVTVDMILNYSVTVTNGGPAISDIHLHINGAELSGLAEAVESYSSSSLTFLGQLQAFAEATTNHLDDSMNLSPDATQLNITKDVLLEATCDGFASISVIDQTYSQVPEPSALALCTLGLVGIHLIRRRRKTVS
jgi:hypothetical protein